MVKPTEQPFSKSALLHRLQQIEKEKIELKDKINKIDYPQCCPVQNDFHRLKNDLHRWRKRSTTDYADFHRLFFNIRKKDPLPPNGGLRVGI